MLGFMLCVFFGFDPSVVNRSVDLFWCLEPKKVTLFLLRKVFVSFWFFLGGSKLLRKQKRSFATSKDLPRKSGKSWPTTSTT